MTVFIICLLVIIGLLLILLEFLVVPGVTVAGIGGLFMISGAVYLCYDNYGTEVGNYSLAGAILIILLALFFALRSKTWKNLMLRTSVDSKSNQINENNLKTGDTGITVSRLAPVGKVMINDEFYEAKSLSGFIDQNKEVTVTKILNTNIIVKLKD